MIRADETPRLDGSLIGERLALDQVPLIDFGAFLDGGPERRKAVAKRIGRACRHIGFFYIVNHGVPEALIARGFAEAKRFFDQPAELKNRISIGRSPCHRGYFSLGGENLDPVRQTEAGDFKEGLKIGRDLPADHPLVRAATPLHGPNQWPEGLPGWRETMERCYADLSRLGHRLMGAFALALELPEDFFEDKLTGPMATLGPLHYPPHPGPVTANRLGAGEHSDFGCLTILAQDEVGGLQVRNSAGRWLDASPVAGGFVVNIGDMMARWTNDLFASTRHRVINRSDCNRYAIPFFFDRVFEADLTCLETCQCKDNPPRYPPTTGGQRLLDMIDAILGHRRKTE